MGIYPNNYLAYPTYMPQNQYPVQPRGMYGRVINNESEITPNEVPMDGSISIFPLSDYSAIIAKQWSADGTIKTLRFIPDCSTSSSTPNNQFNDFAKSIDDRLSNIEKSLSYKKRPYKKNQNGSTTETKVVENE